MRNLSIMFLLSSGFGLMAQDLDSIKKSPFTIHAQSTVISQYKPGFKAKYSGENSLSTAEELQTSLTSTMYLGAKLWKGASVFLNPEIAGGSGLSQALGIAAATNGETFRVGSAEPKGYVARLYMRQVFSLSKESTYQESDLNQLEEDVPNEYFAVTVGKISVADFFDDNKYSHDPRTQFMSWALMDNGAWDYPANTRGYAPSCVLEYVHQKHELRYAASLVPITANGNQMNWNIAKSNSHSIEYTHRHTINKLEGACRLLTFYNTTQMGSYRESIKQSPINPVVSSTRAYGRNKYGIGLNVEQDITQNLGCFFRSSWNDGKNETWVFTEIDRSVSGGIVLDGNSWKRTNDNLGLAFVSSGISKDHREYLGAGGSGFMLGDGAIKYAWEKLTELYYSAELVKKQVYVTGAYQFLTSPGYNKDRKGPVNVVSLRIHTVI